MCCSDGQVRTEFSYSTKHSTERGVGISLQGTVNTFYSHWLCARGAHLIYSSASAKMVSVTLPPSRYAECRPSSMADRLRTFLVGLSFGLVFLEVPGQDGACLLDGVGTGHLHQLFRACARAAAPVSVTASRAFHRNCSSTGPSTRSLSRRNSRCPWAMSRS